jgi:poly(A) polymerase
LYTCWADQHIIGDHIIHFLKKLLRRKQTQPLKTASISPEFIIPRHQHPISKADISPNTLKILNRLIHAGYEAYLVGGVVRDLLVRKAPKDFDVATNATPPQIKALFKNARIIGRRFKLVHILFHREVIEVATFRGQEKSSDHHQVNEQGLIVRDNVYGSLEDDAWRRDFTINSLYYAINDSSIIDFTGGMQDIKQHKIRLIGDPETRYKEDPVRMLRALRFSAKLNFKLEEKTQQAIHQLNHLILQISNARLFEEMQKLYQCGESVSVHHLLFEHGLFQHLFPQTYASMSNLNFPVKEFIILALESTDSRLQAGKPINPAFLCAVFLWFPLLQQTQALKATGAHPLPALEQAMSIVLAKQNQITHIPKRYSQVMREIWLIQYRFPKRTGQRAFNTLKHARFRAAYDFLALRALVNNESMALADWWTAFQEASSEEQDVMIKACDKK